MFVSSEGKRHRFSAGSGGKPTEFGGFVVLIRMYCTNTTNSFYYKVKAKYLIFILILGFAGNKAYSQLQFFDYLEGTYPEGPSKLIPLPDGGWVLTSISSLPIGSIVNTIVLTRYNACGELVSQRSHYFQGIRTLSVADILTEPNGDFWIGFFATKDGPKYTGVLAKFNPEGDVLQSHAYNSEGGYFLYNLDWTGSGEMMLFANVDQPRDRSTITLLDPQGQILISKEIIFTVTWGFGIAADDGGYMCRSGRSFYKVNDQFDVEWLQISQGSYATRKPLKTTDGYIYSFHNYSSINQNVITKIDFAGDVVWQTDDFQTTTATQIKFLKNGNIMQIGTGFPEVGLPAHVVFTEVSPTGELIMQKGFNPDLARPIQGEDFLQLENGAIVFSGRAENGSAAIHSMTTPSFSLLCGDYLYGQSEPSIPLTWQPANSDVRDHPLMVTNLQSIEEQVSMTTNRICFENVLPSLNLPGDTTLCLGDSLIVDLRFIEDKITWHDGSDSRYRKLAAPGEYSINVSRCTQEVEYDIKIEAEDCSCNFYFPNVFSPNGDGSNDRITLLSNCELLNYNMIIFDRWGNALSNTSNPLEGWDGTKNGVRLPPSVYLAKVSFEAFENNVVKEYTFVYDFTLLR